MGDHGARQLSPLFDRRIVRWDDRAKVYKLELDDGFRGILRELMGQFLTLLDDPGAPLLYRLFPPAYSDPGDVALQDEYRRLMMEDLVERRQEECRMVLETAGAKTLTEEQLFAWSRTINSLRLALGTYLDVKDDDQPQVPTSTEESAYQLLSWLLEETIDAMSRHT
ncbi:MAG TPA: DUF2017 family protein [Acidimicrobiales bacterium]|nr:DUF2017 family protein [Acidimicrobiales bacterium]